MYGVLWMAWRIPFSLHPILRFRSYFLILCSLDIASLFTHAFIFAVDGHYSNLLFHFAWINSWQYSSWLRICLWPAWECVPRKWPYMYCLFSLPMQRNSLLVKINARQFICKWVWFGHNRGIKDCKEAASSNFHASSCRLGYAWISVIFSRKMDTNIFEENNKMKIMFKAMILLFNFHTNVVWINQILNFSSQGLLVIYWIGHKFYHFLTNMKWNFIHFLCYSLALFRNFLKCWQNDVCLVMCHSIFLCCKKQQSQLKPDGILVPLIKIRTGGGVLDNKTAPFFIISGL